MQRVHMNTSALLVICIRELRAAYDEAVQEHGTGSMQADAIADALQWMTDWFDGYTRVDTAQQRG